MWLGKTSSNKNYTCILLVSSLIKLSDTSQVREGNKYLKMISVKTSSEAIEVESAFDIMNIDVFSRRQADRDRDRQLGENER